MFHDWTCLVTHIISIRRTPEYHSEPICVLFPATCSSILNTAFCDIPEIEGLDPDVLSFHGQVDIDGTPLTWLPGELAIAGKALYSFDNVFGLGFISTEKKSAQYLRIFSWGVPAWYLSSALCIALSVPPVAAISLSGLLVYSGMSAMGFLGQEVLLRRKRPCDGVVRAAYQFQILETLMTVQ